MRLTVSSFSWQISGHSPSPARMWWFESGTVLSFHSTTKFIRGGTDTTNAGQSSDYFAWSQDQGVISCPRVLAEIGMTLCVYHKTITMLWASAFCRETDNLPSIANNS